MINWYGENYIKMFLPNTHSNWPIKKGDEMWRFKMDWGAVLNYKPSLYWQNPHLQMNFFFQLTFYSIYTRFIILFILFLYI